MINRELCRLALRQPLFALSIATTGAVSLSATATGYARTTGSFIADGFALGHEVTPSGFTQTMPGVITGLTDLSLTIGSGRTVQSAGTRTLTAGLPAGRAWANQTFTPMVGAPFVEDEFRPNTQQRKTIGPFATVEDTGVYYLRLYGVAGVGEAASDRYVNAILSQYWAGRAFVLSTGDVLRIRGDVAPSASSALPYATSWAMVPISIPWRIETRNAA